MKTILIVDDNADALLLTEIALSMLSMKITTQTARSGEQALQMLNDGRELPSLILLDLKMPGMDGIETLRRIRGTARLMHIPVVIVTLSTLEQDEAAAREAGATGFLSKAIKIEEFSRDLLQQVNLHARF